MSRATDRGRVAPPVRPATVDDATALAELHVAAWRVAYQGLLPDEFLDGLSVVDREQVWRGLLGQGVRVVVAEQSSGDRLLGFASFGAERTGQEGSGRGELYALYVHPDLWRTGVGRALHDEALAGLLASQHAEATLWVLDGNERARRFYERHGWRPDGARRVEEVPGARLCELRYRRRLA